MYKIILTGDAEDIYVSDAQGVKLSMDWDKHQLPPVITIGDERFKSSAIKRIVANVSDPNRTDRKAAFAEMIETVNNEHRAEKLQKARQTPETRAHDTSLAQLLFRVVKGRTAAQSDLDFIREKQTEFFKENLDYTYAKPTYLSSEDISQRNAAIKKTEIPMLGDLIPINVLNLAERQIRNGIVR